jgi:hypothetical protein
MAAPKSKNTLIMEANEAEIRRMLAANEHYDVIGDRYDVSKNVVRHWCIRLGIARDTVPKPRRGATWSRKLSVEVAKPAAE